MGTETALASTTRPALRLAPMTALTSEGLCPRPIEVDG
jgi:hypothetical protein